MSIMLRRSFLSGWNKWINSAYCSSAWNFTGTQLQSKNYGHNVRKLGTAAAATSDFVKPGRY